MSLKLNHLVGFGKSGASAPAGDADATAFLTATGITDPTQSDAITNLVLALKAALIWTKMSAIYPFVGGTAATHKYNLKDPRDLDAAFRIVWNGTVTHNANGVTGDGSTGYGDTKLNPSTHLSVDSTHLSVYSRTDNTSEVEAGCWGPGAATERFEVRAKRIGGNAQLGMHVAPGSGGVSVAVATGQGFYIGSRTSSSSLVFYKNGSSIGSSGASAGSLCNENVGICAAIWSSGNSFSSKNIAFVSIGSGLNGTEAAALNTAVETFQDALSRGVV